MRKMLNKKGFSLVELMIVVVIMGILIAVAIPLYGEISKNAKDKTCASNIDTIENAAIVYYNEHGAAATDISQLAFEDGVPVCPWGEVEYTATFSTAGGEATVTCHGSHES